MVLVVRCALCSEKLGMFHGLNFDVEKYLPALPLRVKTTFSCSVRGPSLIPISSRSSPTCCWPTAAASCIMCAEKKRVSSGWFPKGELDRHRRWHMNDGGRGVSSISTWTPIYKIVVRAAKFTKNLNVGTEVSKTAHRRIAQRTTPPRWAGCIPSAWSMSSGSRNR